MKKPLIGVILFFLLCALVAGILKSIFASEPPQRIREQKIEWIERQPERRLA